LVAAKHRMDRVRLVMDSLERDLSLQCRQNPESFHLTKVTEASVVMAVKSHPDYMEAATRVLDSRNDVALLEVAVQAMEQRKRMIEVLVTLHGQQYYAGPSTPRDLVTVYNDYQEIKTANLSQRQKAKVRRRSLDEA